MKVCIDGTEYHVNPIPPSMSLYHIRITELLRAEAKGLQEIRDATSELDALLTELLKECVQPTPAKQHQLTLFNLVMKETDRAIKDAQFFWNQKHGDTAAGSADGASAASSP